MKDKNISEIINDSEFDTIFNSDFTSKSFRKKTGLRWDLPVIIISEEEHIYKRLVMKLLKIIK
jgi:hypothetical protein